MKYFDLGGVQASRVAQGCMRIAPFTAEQVDRLVKGDLEAGINFFDHADIYGGGRCEEKFGDFLSVNPSYRDKLFIQTKCAIKKGSYDFSKAHILESVKGSLKRLKTDYIDFLLLHRPDTLMEPEEVAEAFEELYDQGLVRHFGVSNQHSLQTELLARSLSPKTPILINQLQFSLTNTAMIDAGICVNTDFPGAVNRDGMVLEYSRLKNITIQPWSPFQHGFFEGPFIGNPDYAALNAVLDEIAASYSITSTGLAIAWILRHPAKMQPIVGTTNAERIAAIAKASDITITHDEWYRLYLAGGKKLP